MAEKKPPPPFIVKRVKKSGHAGHSAVWKIAYADFVTAMMAFFLLMWLLSSTAKEELQGIQAYFAAPLKTALTGGEKTSNGSSVIPGGGDDLTRAHGQNRNLGLQEAKRRRMELEAARARQDRERIESLQARIAALITETPRLSEYRSQIRIDMTPDGLLIQITDEQNRPMFDSGSALVKPYMRDILHAIGAALGGVENRISLAGHTDAVPYGNSERGYSNWELSADRANASRRELVSAGMPDAKLGRVVGLAASDLLVPENPRAPANRRITITVLTQEAEERLMGKGLPAIPAAALLDEKQEHPAPDR
ncbi:motility protein MotB [Verminephrobacter aporrectodeae subsp. tuberculatae]|uniref:flagellar motor protein MotB n=1 Tax=Verminephrobacter aporrectodeae TaxID=1110389 RepID=UPI002243D580|nr:flagellar motor protein MotB [Verminephrobacter aporrectodeae]MCW8205679.1 motility protein MotB [Verminephrobacter aporrectodeae subsp. tuberculatae]